MDRLRRMQIFVSIVEAGQFTRAADTLGLTKSAVSHAISDLEDYLGVKLLQRNKSGIQVTEAGQNYYERCLQILSDIGDMEDSTRNVDSALSGRIKISAPTEYGIQHIVPHIAAFSEQYPAVELTLDLSDRHIDLTEEQVDVAIRVSKASSLTPLMHPLGHVTLNLCASPSYMRTKGPIKTLKALKSVNCLKYSGMNQWSLLRPSGKTVSFQPHGSIVSNNGVAIRDLAIAGSGVAYLPDFLANDALTKGELVSLNLDDVSCIKLRSYAFFPPNRHRPLRVQRFVEFLAPKIESAPASKRSYI